MAVLQLSSCVLEDPKSCSDTTTDLTFSIQLNNEEQTAETRSGGVTWEGPYGTSDALIWEKSIYSMAVYAYKTDGEYFGRFTDMIQVGTGLYNAHLVKSNNEYAQGSDLEGQTLRFHVFVNVIPNPAATESGLFNLSSTWLRTDGKYNQAYMPMWGIKQVELNWEAIPGTDQKKVADLGTVDLLRSVTKVEIEITNTDDDYDVIDYVTVRGNRAMDFRLVPGYGETSYDVLNITETKQLEIYQENFKTDATKTAVNTLFYPLATNKKKAIFYIPEQTNVSGSTEVEMVITSGGETFSDSPLKFCDYVSGQPVGNTKNIIRNHHYKYNVNIRKGRLEIVVLEWENSFKNHFNF